MTQIIDGTKLANELCAKLAIEVATLPRPPLLVAILVGDDPASHIYVKRKEVAAKKAGIRSQVIRLGDDTSERILIEDYINRLNNDPEVDGILVQLPLPKHIDQKAVVKAIDPEKDVDGFHPMNAGRLMAGDYSHAPCTPKAIMRLLEASGTTLAGVPTLMIGRSIIIGQPTAIMLTKANATVTIAHNLTRNIPELCRQAEVIVVAVGKPDLIRGSYLQSGVTIIDVGINRLPDGKIVGDCSFDECLKVARAITPVPGGVGPMTIACLLENTVEACKSLTIQRK